MSSFRQLMMKKKEETNYITLSVVGTLTNNNGVISGFGTSNYLTMPLDFAFGDDFELQFKFTTGELVSSVQTLFNFTTAPAGDTERISMNITNYSTCNVIFRTSLNSYVAIDTPNIFSSNTTYYIKYIYINSHIDILLSTDGTSWQTLVSQNISGTPLFSTRRWIGNSSPSQTDRNFRGSVDLKESYVIKSGIKYIFTV